MIKKILIITAVIVILAVAAVFYYRYQLISLSAESLIRKSLPGYVKIDKIKFNFKESMAFFEGVRLEGPSGFSDRYLVEIAEISCRYKLKGATMFDGLETMDPVLKDMVLQIERLQDGRVNLSEMGNVIGSAVGSQKSLQTSRPAGPEADVGGQPAVESASGEPGKAGEDKESPSLPKDNFIKLPHEFKLKNGKIILTDRFFVRGYNVLTFNNIEAVIALRMNDSFSQVLDVASTGVGNINGHKDQSVKWVIKFNPNTPKLTMSGRIDLFGADLITFEPYYDKFSPFEFAQCRVSGFMEFNLDNGNIGSTNELHLANLVFSIKPGAQNAAMFDTTVQDLTRYFTTFTGEVVFDFKIKGDMANPRFFLGPISKQAITAMVMDKVGDLLQKMSRKGSEAVTTAAGSTAAETANTSVDNTKQIIDMVKGFLDKKN